MVELKQVSSAAIFHHLNKIHLSDENKYDHGIKRMYHVKLASSSDGHAKQGHYIHMGHLGHHFNLSFCNE